MSDSGYSQNPYGGGEQPAGDPYVEYGSQYGSGTPGATGPPPDVLAGFWIRFAGALLDGLLVGIVTSLLIWPIVDGTPRLLQLAIAGAYFTYFHTTKAGQTPGMRVCGIRVVDAAAAGRVEPGAALVRWLMSYISGFALALGYLWMLWDDRNQTWHDKVAKTVVVKADRVPPPAQSIFER